MLLDNFDYWQFYRLYTESTGTISSDSNPIRNTAGEAFQIYITSNTTTTFLSLYSAKNLSITVGTGSSAPSKTDYKLENSVSASMTFTTRTHSVVIDNAKNTHVICQASGHYTGEDTVTLREIGILKTLYTSSSSTNNTTSVLLARSLLEKPITLNTNDSFAIEYEIVFGQGTVNEVVS
jgi:hypothetical protein